MHKGSIWLASVYDASQNTIVTTIDTGKAFITTEIQDKIFVYLPKRLDSLLATVRLVPGVLQALYSSIPESDWDSLLANRVPEPELYIGMWVSICYGPYNRQVGLVSAIREAAIDILIAPVLQLDNDSGTPPTVLLFDPSQKYIHLLPPISVEGRESTWKSGDCTFTYGLREVTLDPDDLSLFDVTIDRDVSLVFSKAAHPLVNQAYNCGNVPPSSFWSVEKGASIWIPTELGLFQDFSAEGRISQVYGSGAIFKYTSAEGAIGLLSRIHLRKRFRVGDSVSLNGNTDGESFSPLLITCVDVGNPWAQVYNQTIKQTVRISDTSSDSIYKINQNFSIQYT